MVLYSTDCPMCRILKQKLDDKEIAYTENNSIDDMEKLGITRVPVLDINGQLHDFNSAMMKIQNM